MTPNLFLATQKVFQPHKWFRAPKTERSARVTEYWTSPEPGQYEYIPGRGWYLIARPEETSNGSNEPRDQEGGPVQPQHFTKLDRPIPVRRSRVLGRYLLEDDYNHRKVTTQLKNDQGKRVQAGFFQLDNRIAWVHCWDENGTFIPGDKSGYKLWCIDAATKEFRHMRKGDDPAYVRSRRSSPQRGPVNRSQDSLSTTFPSAPGSAREGTSTTASSVRGMMSPTSTPSSRVQSRRNSPKRNNSVPLEDAKAALRRMAKEHEEAITAAAAKNRTTSTETVAIVERGRLLARIAS